MKLRDRHEYEVWSKTAKDLRRDENWPFTTHGHKSKQGFNLVKIRVM